MRQFTRRDRLRYQFDTMMAKGPAVLIGWLAIVSLVVISLVSFIVRLLNLDPEGRNFFQLVWVGLMRTLDPGMGEETSNWPFLFAMLVITLTGIFVVSSLIGILTTGLESQLEQLRKGRSLVAETGHSLILGWSPQIFTLVSELVLANENQPRSCIVVLAEKDAVEMQDEIRARVGKTGRTRIVFRTGVPHDITDLQIVNPGTTHSIVILSPEDENADAYVIKTILALTNHPQRPAKPYHIVAVLHDEKNLAVARMIGRNEVQLISSDDLIARLTAQTCRQSGLSIAYTELLDFSGDEIYFKAEPALVGKFFHDSLFAYDDSAVMGIRFRDGRIRLNPPMQTVLEEGDQLIAISADDDTIQLSQLDAPPIAHEFIRQATHQASAPESTLILGWNGRAPRIIRQLDQYVAPGSAVQIVSSRLQEEDEDSNGASSHKKGYANLTCTLTHGDATDRSLLNTLALESYNYVIVLSEAIETGMNDQEIDARTLITLLHLRDICDKGGFSVSIVSEMLDIRNRELAAAARANDFVVSDNLISLMLSQISENKELAHVFQDLFDPKGSEIYFKPAGDYAEPGQAVNFYTITEAARLRDEVAIGYRIQADANSTEKAYGVTLNPVKSQSVTFGIEDRIIVLAED